MSERENEREIYREEQQWHVQHQEQQLQQWQEQRQQFIHAEWHQMAVMSARDISLSFCLSLSLTVFMFMSLYLYHGVFLFLHLSFTLGFPIVAACMCVGSQSALLRDMELSVKPTSKTYGNHIFINLEQRPETIIFGIRQPSASETKSKAVS
jgi:hypothetical protein